MHRELIDKIIAEGDHEDMECLKHILVDLIDELSYTDRDKYKKVEYKLYKKAHKKGMALSIPFKSYLFPRVEYYSAAASSAFLASSNALRTISLIISLVSVLSG